MKKSLFVFTKYNSFFYKKYIIYIVLLIGFCSCNKNKNTVEETSSTLGVTVLADHLLPAILHESSGLCYTDGNLWTFGDSGNPNEIFKIDTITGAILQTVIIQNFPNEDWEDITADSLYIYVGDFGNNDGDRKDLKILRIKKSDFNNTLSQISVDADVINFSYADQVDFVTNSNTNFDCEALITVEDNLYLFSKDRGDLQTRCYKLPKLPDTYSLSPISSFNTYGEVTSASFNPITKELALGGYMNEKQFPFIWFFKDYTGNDFFEGKKIKVPLTISNTPWQTEGIDYTSTNRMFLSCESTPAIPATLYTVELNIQY